MINIKRKLHPNLLDIFKKNILIDYRIILKLKTHSKNLIKKFNNSKNCKLIHFIDHLNIACLIVNHKFLANLIESPEVEYVCFDSEVHLVGNKTFTNVKTSDSKTLLNASLTGKNITVGIIDSGIYPHDFFKKPINRIVFFKDLINDLNYPYDDNGHGTAMCNIIGDKFIYRNTLIKTAYECNFCVIKAFDKYNNSYSSLIFKALDLLLEQSENLNVQTICLPFELNEFNPFLLSIYQDFFNKLSHKNILITLPIGNNLSNYSSIKGLCLLNNCITIGGTNYKESSLGNTKLLKPTVTAISEKIYLLNIDSKYVPERDNQYIYPPKLNNTLVEYFGTSCSCAYVCGLLTMLKEKNVLINTKDTLSLLKISCIKDTDIDKSIQGYGTININQLLE